MNRFFRNLLANLKMSGSLIGMGILMMGTLFGIAIGLHRTGLPVWVQIPTGLFLFMAIMTAIETWQDRRKP